MGFLYKLDFANGKSYIGITTKSVEHRLNAHINNVKSRRRAKLYAAWRKYGEPRLSVVAILEDDQLAETEMRAIAVYGTMSPNGYNMTSGGDTSPMKERSVVDKMLKTKRENGLFGKISDEGRKNISETHKGNTYTLGKKIHTEEWKQILAERMKGNSFAKGNKGNIGLKRTPEQIEANRTAHLGKRLSEETKERMRQAQRIRRANEKKVKEP